MSGGSYARMDDNGHVDTIEEMEEGPSEVRLSGLDENGDGPQAPSTVFFNDGARKTDFVLAYKEHTDDKEEARVEKRRVFEANLEREGLELELEDKIDGKTHFVKVHAPWEVLSRVAELMSIKMPIKEYDGAFETSCWDKLPTPFDLPKHLQKDEPDYFTADFNREREHMFIIKDKDTFFSPAQRSLMVYTILLRARYDVEDRQKFGIDRLLKHGVYIAAFPLHDGKHTSPHSILTQGPANDRHYLYEAWARPKQFYKNQPLDEIRHYFGEKVAIYFSWLGFYTTMLIPASFVGLMAFIYGCATVFDNPPSEEICDAEGAGNLTMCPLCDRRCTYWKLAASCTYSRLTYLFDNYGTVFFAGFMSIWATCFLEFWKRKQAEIQYDWDVATLDMEEHVRPDFEAKCQKKKLNPITQEMEPYLPWYSKVPRKMTSFVVILVMIFMVLAAVFGVIMYRIIVVALLYASDEAIIRKNAKLTTTATAALINLIAIMVLNKLYERVAMWLTDLERPRTDSEYEDSFTLKMFLFQFVNYYSSIVYVALFKGRLGGRPGAYDYSLSGYRAEECDPAGCLIELCIQLAIVMVGKQTINNFKEILLPMIMNKCRQRSAKEKENEGNLYTRWEQDNDLQSQPALGLFEEYLEMVIQFGFVTIFVAAFPLAPLFALINNIIEIRLDAYKFVTQWRRPVAERANDIGVWYGILRGIVFIAVLMNAFIIGWTSDFIPKMVYKFAISGNDTLEGYVDHSLSVFDVNDFQPQSVPDKNMSDVFGPVTECRYHDYRYPPGVEPPLVKYKYTADHWHVFMGRLAFIIIFEHAVFFLTWIVSYLIPDVSGHVRQLMLREMFLAKEARYETTFEGLEDDKKARKEKEKEPKSQ